MAGIPSVLVDFNAFLKNTSYAGKANKITLPKVVMKTLDFDGAGIGGTVKRSVGKLEAMEMEATISDYSKDVMGMVGSRSSRNEVVTFRGALDRDGEIKTVIVRASGFWRELEFNEWVPGSEATNKVVIDVEYFELEIDGKLMLKIDKLRNNFTGADGKDRNEEIRNALGQ